MGRKSKDSTILNQNAEKIRKDILVQVGLYVKDVRKSIKEKKRTKEKKQSISSINIDARDLLMLRENNINSKTGNFDEIDENFVENFHPLKRKSWEEEDHFLDNLPSEELEKMAKLTDKIKTSDEEDVVMNDVIEEEEEEEEEEQQQKNIKPLPKGKKGLDILLKIVHRGLNEPQKFGVKSQSHVSHVIETYKKNITDVVKGLKMIKVNDKSSSLVKVINFLQTIQENLDSKKINKINISIIPIGSSPGKTDDITGLSIASNRNISSITGTIANGKEISLKTIESSFILLIEEIIRLRDFTRHIWMSFISTNKGAMRLFDLTVEQSESIEALYWGNEKWFDDVYEKHKPILTL